MAPNNHPQWPTADAGCTADRARAERIRLQRLGLLRLHLEGIFELAIKRDRAMAGVAVEAPGRNDEIAHRLGSEARTGLPFSASGDATIAIDRDILGPMPPGRR